MTSELSLPAPQMLALAYAPLALRPCFGWLLLFDRRLGEVLDRAREPMIAQMRLAWWRDALAAPAEKRPKGEPLLAQFATLETADFARTAAALVDAWELAMVDDTSRAAKQRAAAIFQSYAKWADCSLKEQEIAMALGQCWADPAAAGCTSAVRKLRPLSILSMAAQLERTGGTGRGLRLSWHALTGR